MKDKNLNVIHVELGAEGREKLCLKLWLDTKQVILRSELSGIGGPELLSQMEIWRPRLKGQLSQLEVPQGHALEEILMREAVLKATGRWDFPVKQESLCFCRQVKTRVVDEVVIAGAHTPKEVSLRTFACTGCGTCQPRVQKVIDYRLGLKPTLVSSSPSKK